MNSSPAVTSNFMYLVSVDALVVTASYSARSLYWATQAIRFGFPPTGRRSSSVLSHAFFQWSAAF